MRRMTIWKILAAVAVLAMFASAGMAQPCTSDVPAQLYIGDSYCVRICPWGYYPAIELIGTFDGPDAMPVLIIQSGCHPDQTLCENSSCISVEVPELVWEGNPYYPGQWYGVNDCMEVFFYFGHDNIWWIEILPLACQGCFCITYDYQLSVELTSFDAVGGDGEVSVTWRTASETDNARFEIERDGQLIYSVPGLGTSPTGQAYAWTDRDVTNGTTYAYALYSVDVNSHRQNLGSVNATPTTSVATVTEYALYQNYPNPFNPSTTIAFDLVQADHVTLKIFNPMGEEVSVLRDQPMTAGHHTVNFNARSLTSGLYFYTISVGDRFTATRKMLLVK